MASKKYALVPMEEPTEEVPRRREHRNRDRDRHGSHRKHRSRSRSPRDARIADLREKSRQEYMGKRSAEKLVLLRKQVAEETAELRSGVKLSRQEKDEFARNRELLRTLEDMDKIDDFQDGYRLPSHHDTDTKSKWDVLHTREKQDPSKEKHITEFEEWEQEQTAKSRLLVQDEAPEDEYAYLLDEDAISFVRGGMYRPPESASPQDAQLLEKIEAAEKARDDIRAVRKTLPVYSFRDDLLDAIKQHQVLIVVGETGSGKTTQIPQYLHEAGYTENGMKVACTQPRRVAAMSVAKRVSEEMDVRLGREVGYSIRFDNCTSDKTLIKYLTDGMLLKEFMTEPDLSEYSAIMIDEAHERTVQTDILLGLIKDLARARPDLRVILSSATMNAQRFAAYYDDAPIFNIPGRTFPVEIYYTSSPEASYVAAAVVTVFQIHVSQPAGDILVFLAGQEDIDETAERIMEIRRKLGTRVKDLICAPIYSTMPSEQQNLIFAPTPPDSRKVVLATNIAETSITIDGIIYVVDSGYVKENVFTLTGGTGKNTLTLQPCSRAAATQRAGRAGRNRPGKCFRLYTRHSYLSEMEETQKPEVLRSNLAAVVLQLKTLGIDDIFSFDWVDKPPDQHLIKSMELLHALKALDTQSNLTRLGRQMSEFPLDPLLSAALIAAGAEGCVSEMLIIVAILPETASLFMRPKGSKKHADAAHQRLTVKDGGDFLLLLNLFLQWVETGYSTQWAKENYLAQRSLKRARDVRDQLEALCERILEGGAAPSCGGPTHADPLRRALTAAFFLNAATLDRRGNGYRTLRNSRSLQIHPSSVCRAQDPPPRVILFYELFVTSKDGKEYARGVLPIKPEWLAEFGAHYYDQQKELEPLEVKKMPKQRK